MLFVFNLVCRNFFWEEIYNLFVVSKKGRYISHWKETSSGLNEADNLQVRQNDTYEVSINIYNESKIERPLRDPSEIGIHAEASVISTKNML